jgi:hypothetical protein
VAVAGAQVVVEFDEHAYQVFIEGVQRRDLERRTRNVRRLAKNLAPKGRTGNLRRSLKIDIAGSRGDWVGTVYADDTIAPHAIMVHDGTGQGTGGRIYPKNGRALRWKPRGSRRAIYRPSVRGQRGQPFLRNAIGAARD